MKKIIVHGHLSISTGITRSFYLCKKPLKIAVRARLAAIILTNV
jgi:hypothetical protein